MGSLINWIKNNPTKILTGATITGIIVSSILSFHAGTKASRIIDEAKEELEKTDPNDKEIRREIMFDAGKKMAIPTISTLVTIGLTIFCCVKNHNLNAATIASISSLASISAKQVADINAEMINSLGDKKAKEIRGKALKRRFDIDHPNDGNEFKCIEDCGGNILCGDAYTDKYWSGSVERMNRAIEDLAYECADMGKVSLNDLYLKNGAKYCPIAETVIWTLRDLTYVEDNFGNRRPKLPIETTTFVAFNGKPCLGLIYNINN